MKQANASILAELRASGRLPSPAGVALTILELTRRSDTSTEELSDVLQCDPALTGQILKYANRSDSVARFETTCVNDALVRLGMNLVRQLSLGFSVLSNSRKGSCVEFDYQHYWTRSLAVAVGCQVISRKISSVSPEEGFTCGLLSQIGQLALASVYPQEYGEILSAWNGRNREALLKLELERLSIDHDQVTVAVFEDWGLPEYYHNAALRRGDREWLLEDSDNSTEKRSRKLAGLLNIADLAADICLEQGPEVHRLVLDFLKIGKDYQIDEEIWITTSDEIMAEWGRMGKILDVVTRRLPAMENLVNRARNYNQPISDLKTNGTSPAKDEKTIGQPADHFADTKTEFGLHILLATDSPVDMRVLEKNLTAQGHRLSEAVNGKEALELALTTSPQLILTDWMMPEMDGLELCRTLRSSDQTLHTYVIIMTSNNSNEQLIEGFDAGINDYVIKPLNQRIIAARIRGASHVIQLREQTLRDQEELRKNMRELGIANREKEQAYEKMKTMALEDQLTKLPNRRAGMDNLDREWARATRSRGSMLVMILDIDHFKNVNDTYGHDAGDEVLRQTASVLKSTMRDSDLVCRFGGEEFLVVCPGADIDVAKQLGDRIRLAVEQNKIDYEEFQKSITISIGVAVRTNSHESPKDLIKEADEALYAAKEAGRNLVCISGPGESG